LPTPKLTPEVVTAIRSHTWPGNVRELRHSFERALLLSEPGTIDTAELIEPRKLPRPATPDGMPFPATLRDITRTAANRAVAVSDGNKSRAARILGISRSRLQRLLDDEGEEDTDD